MPPNDIVDIDINHFSKTKGYLTMNNDKLAAARRAAALRKLKPVFLDTETTGLDTHDQICDLAIVDHDGTILLDTLIKPTIPIPAGATRIHNITNEDVANAPDFMEVLFPDLVNALADRVIVIYNASYDIRMLKQSARAHDHDLMCHLDPFSCYCAMELYAQFYGDWSDWHQSYRWQKLGHAACQCDLALPPDLHRARADAELTRLVTRHMAAHYRLWRFKRRER